MDFIASDWRKSENDNLDDVWLSPFGQDAGSFNVLTRSLIQGVSRRSLEGLGIAAIGGAGGLVFGRYRMCIVLLERRLS